MNIRLVEIEIHSFCNRRCNWCPNSFIDRMSNKINMDEKIYLKILNNLKDMNYNGHITYSRYNEPLFDIKLLRKRIEQAKTILPNVKIITNTNGDYLKDLDDLLMIDEITIMDYDNKGNKYIEDKLNSLGVENISITDKGITAKYKTLKILYHNFWKDVKISNRGGSLKTEEDERTYPCYEPNHFIGIDYNGKVVPCCNIRSDYHSGDLILGNLTNENLYDIINSNKAKEFRKEVNGCNFNSICKYCNNKGGRYTSNNSGISYCKKGG